MPLKNLFDPIRSTEMIQRLDRLRPDSPRQWGKMTASQAVAHCAIAFECALGDTRPRRMVLGRILGGVVKRFGLRDDSAMRPGSPTSPDMVVADQRDLDTERRRLRGLIDRFTAAGPSGCTNQPHSFFGRLTPEQWAVLMYKHTDHHLRQFGV
jgi:hypothetical protein